MHLCQNLNFQFKADYTEKALKTKQILRIEWTKGNHPPDSLLQEIKSHKCEVLSHVIKDTFGIPSSWSNALAVISTRNKPGFIDQKYWDRILLSIPDLLKGNPSWISTVINHGWSMTDIFGCHPTSPQNRIDYMGILLLLHGKEIIEVLRDVIILKTTSGAIQTYRRPFLTSPEQTTLDLLPDEELSDLPDDPLPTLYPVRNGISVESYRPLVEERKEIYKAEGTSDGEAQWKAFNDVVLKFIDDTKFSLDSDEVYGFIKELIL